MYLSGVYLEAGSLRVMMALLAVCIVAANWWYGRHVLAGHTTYWKALLVGIVIGVSMGLVYVAYNAVSISFAYAHFLEDMVQAEFARVTTALDKPPSVFHATSCPPSSSTVPASAMPNGSDRHSTVRSRHDLHRRGVFVLL
jgi:hypothetical protein